MDLPVRFMLHPAQSAWGTQQRIQIKNNIVHL